MAPDLGRLIKARVYKRFTKVLETGTPAYGAQGDEEIKKPPCGGYFLLY